MKKVIIKTIVALLCSLIMPAASLGMTFKLEKPPSQIQYIVGGAYWIFAEGPITPDSGLELERFLNQNNVPKESIVFLNSPGGSVYGGMALGRIIRKWKLNVDVGQRTSNGDSAWRERLNKGYCYSACTFAYLGGYFRFLNRDSQYGVHRFTTKGFEGDEESAQIVSSSIANYIIEMGTDVRLLEISSSVPKNDLKILTGSELLNLKIVNNGTLLVSWSYYNSGDYLYLKGERDTQFGIQKLIFGCTGKPRELISIFMFESKDRQRDIITHQAEEVSLDEKIFDIKSYRISKNIIVGDYMSYVYQFPKSILDQMLNSKEISFFSKPTKSSALFFGFQSLPFTDGRQKLRAIISNCN